MSTERVILHADLDAFFASVEQLDDPSLRGRPVLVGGTGPRGVVCAASYEARPFGCRSAMATARARTLCPHAVIVRPRFARYVELSERFMAILGRVAPRVESLSLDEAFVDATGSVRLLGPGPEIARTVRRATRDELGLAVSVGVGPCKFVAKLASDLCKPDGLLAVPAAGLAEWLAPLGIERMWGIGPKTLPRYHAADIRTFGDLQRMDAEALHALLGDHGAAAQALAFGRDERAVESEHEARGVGKERTFAADITDPESVLAELHALTQAACARLRAKGGRTRRFSLKIRFGHFETITRSATLDHETDSTQVVWRAARETFAAWAARSFQPVRLVGIRLERLAEGAFVHDLFAHPAEERSRALDRVADAIEARFGAGAARRGIPGPRPQAGEPTPQTGAASLRYRAERAGGQQRSPHSSE